MSSQTIQQTIANYFAATRAMSLESWLATFAEDAISYEPDAPPLKGYQDLTHFFQGIISVFQQIGLTEESVFINGNEAAVKWIGHGVGKNGQEVAFEGIDVFEINDAGKIQQMWAYWYPQKMMAQLA
ncbi:nuclear transport factor 2 family protein [Calothrix sp. 336/3]|uniref:nuclear transport factor 2 family protein n=1 Tax=Calothrix sp. 336/3 TaxID=1337936 RepID=UPI0004E2EC2A|nr:nuclear transport factor 2 family protein [Calothrix sp. 336/3]AKG23025.1 ketosteroid isomerase [Calothrix sp. 336/3]